MFFSAFDFQTTLGATCLATPCKLSLSDLPVNTFDSPFLPTRTPHYSGTTLDAQARYANGARLILENYFGGKPQQPKDIIAGEFFRSTRFLCLSLNMLISLFPSPENGVIVSKAYDRAGKIETKAHVEKETYN